MTKNNLLTTIFACLATATLQAQNPIICDRYTPDPAPYVHGDTLYPNSKSGSIKGRITIEPTNGEWTDVTCDLTSPISGIQDLFFTFSGSIGSESSLFDFDSWQFNEETTGILSLETEESKKDHATYDLQGCRTKGKGIRIRDGKKIVN